MEDRESEREIEVRSLTGESIAVSISPYKTIQDLKLLLTQTFPPASASLNFHLYLKGVKLSLQSEINSHLPGAGEFLVLVPFKKKNQQQTQKQSVTPSTVSNQASSSKLADSAWSDLMQDLSSLRAISGDENQANIHSDAVNLEDRSAVHARTSVIDSTETKCKRVSNGNKQEELLDDLVLGILQSSSKNLLDEQNRDRLIQVLGLLNCFSDPASGNCLLKEADIHGSEAELSADKSGLCLCPSWLKRILKAFAFLNIYYAFIQLQQLKITLTALRGALDLFFKFGLQVGIADLEHLSVLCPKVVCFVDNEAEGKKPRDALVIIKCAMEQTDHVESKTNAAQKRMPISKIVSAMKRRKSSFITNLWGAVKSLMEVGTTASRHEAKRTRKSCSATSSAHSFEARCHDTNPLVPVEMVEHLKRGIGCRGQIVHIEEINARKATYVSIPSELSENAKSALKCLGVTRLYSHQAESIQASLAGKNVVVATMTSSGKSLCFNLPVLEVLYQNVLACALYLFPTKALAQDQLRALLSMTKGFDASLPIGVYDGDTSQEDRIWLRDNSRLLITNPDMLHVSILPFHGQFRRLLSNLRFVIIDEAHAYKGAFGCHTALILRRLRRLCSHVYGSDPSFVFCTATSANPREHAMELANLPTTELIQNDGSPSGPKLFLLWNPPLCLKTELANLPTTELIQNDGSPSGPKLFLLWNPPLCLKTVSKRTRNSTDANKSANKSVVVGRLSPILEVSFLFAEIVQHGLRCIAFCKTRNLCELVLIYTYTVYSDSVSVIVTRREILQETAPHLVDSICAYRAGYIARDRRRIEGDFFGGNLCGIAATNALELGIDVGHIDVTLHLGFPGTIASLWQQAGRSGRRGKPSLAVYVAFEGPLDQYFMKFPKKLFRSPIERCHLDAKNQQVLEQHLVCAALEHPLSLLHDEKFFGSGLKNAIMALKNSGYLSTDPSRPSSDSIWSYIGHEKMPSHGVNIRAIETERYKVIDKQKNEVLEEIEESRAFFQVMKNAPVCGSSACGVRH
ncbi:unnamed protein product [Ilex paraguariensis]|uniref:Uncharacterized protein n=1 Tax=Ilex paraguariensis TaxID=185542 RepID=A0ABC8RUX1_9AQUA